MKHVSIIPAILLLVSSYAAAQDMPPTGIGYIPGMPVPQQSAPKTTPEVNSKPSGSGDGGRISQVRVAGTTPTTATQSQPVVQDKSVDPKGGLSNYKGVTPPTRLVPANDKTFTRTPDNQLSWIGFMPEEGAHRVFIQTTRASRFERVATPNDRVELIIEDTKLAVSNNRRELDMTYFQTPFSKAKAERSGSGVRITVQLKEPAQCDVRQNDNMIDIIVRK